jgi:hypothetical protein
VPQCPVVPAAVGTSVHFLDGCAANAWSSDISGPIAVPSSTPAAVCTSRNRSMDRVEKQLGPFLVPQCPVVPAAVGTSVHFLDGCAANAWSSDISGPITVPSNTPTAVIASRNRSMDRVEKQLGPFLVPQCPVVPAAVGTSVHFLDGCAANAWSSDISGPITVPSNTPTAVIASRNRSMDRVEKQLGPFLVPQCPVVPAAVGTSVHFLDGCAANAWSSDISGPITVPSNTPAAVIASRNRSVDRVEKQLSGSRNVSTALRAPSVDATRQLSSSVLTAAVALSMHGQPTMLPGNAAARNAGQKRVNSSAVTGLGQVPAAATTSLLYYLHNLIEAWEKRDDTGTRSCATCIPINLYCVNGGTIGGMSSGCTCACATGFAGCELSLCAPGETAHIHDHRRTRIFQVAAVALASLARSAARGRGLSFALTVASLSLLSLRPANAQTCTLPPGTAAASYTIANPPSLGLPDLGLPDLGLPSLGAPTTVGGLGSVTCAAGGGYVARATCTNSSGGAKWRRGVLAPSGRIYGIPCIAQSVLIIDPVGASTDTTTLGGLSSGGFKWIGGVLAPNGRIYGIPANAQSVLIIDPVNASTDTTTLGLMPGTGNVIMARGNNDSTAASLIRTQNMQNFVQNSHVAPQMSHSSAAPGNTAAISWASRFFSVFATPEQPSGTTRPVAEPSNDATAISTEWHMLALDRLRSMQNFVFHLALDRIWNVQSVDRPMPGTGNVIMARGNNDTTAASLIRTQNMQNFVQNSHVAPRMSHSTATPGNMYLDIVQQDSRGLETMRELYTDDSMADDLAEIAKEMGSSDEAVGHCRDQLAATGDWWTQFFVSGLGVGPTQKQHFRDAVKDLRGHSTVDFALHSTVLPKWPRWRPRRRVTLCIGNDSCTRAFLQYIACRYQTQCLCDSQILAQSCPPTEWRTRRRWLLWPRKCASAPTELMAVKHLSRTPRSRT